MKPLSEIRAESREETRLQVEDEMRFLHQDGYGGKWAETKKDEIYGIVESAEGRILQAVVEKIEGMTKKEKAFGGDMSEDELMINAHANGYNERLSALKAYVIEGIK